MDRLLALADGGLQQALRHPGRGPRPQATAHADAGPASATGVLLLATRSRHKLAELRELLDLPGVELLTPDEVGIEGEPVEDAATFRGNAVIKARYYAARSGLPTLADDSGLEVDALGGGPGVHTRRYAGPDATDATTTPSCSPSSTACPPSGAARATGACSPSSTRGRRCGRGPVFREGTFEGRIATSPRGDGGFGYDPIFEPESEPPGGRTVGQMSAAEKNALSHRGKAARAMAEYLRAEGW